MVLHQVEHPFDAVTTPASVALRTVHEAHEHGPVADHERGHAEDPEFRDGPLVLVAYDLGRPAGVHLAENRLGVHTGTGQGIGHDGTVTQVAPLVVAGGEEGEMHGTELLGQAVASDHAGRQGHEVRLGGRVLPRRGATFRHVSLIEEEGNKGHFPGSSGVEASEHVLVAVAGEGAAVVPGHGELTVCHAPSNAPVRRDIPPRSSTSVVDRGPGQVSGRDAAQGHRRPARWPCHRPRRKRDGRANGRG